MTKSSHRVLGRAFEFTGSNRKETVTFRRQYITTTTTTTRRRRRPPPPRPPPSSKTATTATTLPCVETERDGSNICDRHADQTEFNWSFRVGVTQACVGGVVWPSAFSSSTLSAELVARVQRSDCTGGVCALPSCLLPGNYPWSGTTVDACEMVSVS